LNDYFLVKKIRNLKGGGGNEKNSKPVSLYDDANVTAD
jgi:hypothetical protein